MQVYFKIPAFFMFYTIPIGGIEAFLCNLKQRRTVQRKTPANFLFGAGVPAKIML